jgi:hypothetical protein
MLEVVVALAIIALIALFLRAGRQNTIVYRKRVAPRDEDYSTKDNQSAFSQRTDPDYYPGSESGSAREALAFGGGEFGGAGAGDSYDVGPTDAASNDFGNFDAAAGDFSNADPVGSDSDCSDSGNDDCGSGNDSGSDSSSDSSGSSCD